MTAEESVSEENNEPLFDVFYFNLCSFETNRRPDVLETRLQDFKFDILSCPSLPITTSHLYIKVRHSLGSVAAIVSFKKTAVDYGIFRRAQLIPVPPPYADVSCTDNNTEECGYDGGDCCG